MNKKDLKHNVNKLCSILNNFRDDLDNLSDNIFKCEENVSDILDDLENDSVENKTNFKGVKVVRKMKNPPNYWGSLYTDDVCFVSRYRLEEGSGLKIYCDQDGDVLINSGNSLKDDYCNVLIFEDELDNLITLLQKVKLDREKGKI